MTTEEFKNTVIPYAVKLYPMLFRILKNEEETRDVEQQAQLQFEKQRERFEKQRELAEKYGRQPIFLSTPGDTNTVYYIDGKKVKSDKVKELLKNNEVEKIEKTNDGGKTVIKIKTKKALK